MTANPVFNEALLSHTKQAQKLILDAVPDYQHPDDDTIECQYCGYAEYSCICDLLCFWRSYVGAPPCLEPKENASDETCSGCRADYLADQAENR